MKKSLISIILTLALVFTIIPSLVFAEEMYSIVLPESVEHGTFTAMQNGNVLNNGDFININDVITFTSTPDEGYRLLSGTPSGEIILDESKITQVFFNNCTENVTSTDLSDLSEKTDGYANRNDGLYSIFSKNSTGTKTATMTVGEGGFSCISFDWSVNQGYTGYGKFKLKFYVNNVLKIERDYTSNTMPYDTFITETYNNELYKDDVLKWVFEKTNTGTWADSYGRIVCLSRVREYRGEYIPEPPIFSNNIHNAIITPIKNGSVQLDSNDFVVGSQPTITVIEDEGYYLSDISVSESNGDPVQITKTGDFTYSFVMPDNDVTISATFSPQINIATKEDLINFIQATNQNPQTHAVLTNDIDMENAEISPIQPSSLLINNSPEISQLGFSGNFDGRYHKISNFTVKSDSTQVTAGLFGTVSGTVENLVIDNATYKNPSCDGRYSVLCGQLLTKGVIQNCVVINSTVLCGSYIGGAVAGCNYGGTIKNSVAYNNTVSGYQRIGNFIGDNENDTKDLIGTLENCYSDKNVYGSQSGTVTNCQSNVTDINKIAYLLNTQNETASHSGYWSTTNNCVVPANEENKTIYKVLRYFSNNLENVYYAKIDSILTIDGTGIFSLEYDGDIIEKNSDGNYTITVKDEDAKQINVEYSEFTITYETNGGVINSGSVTKYITKNGATLPKDVTKDGVVFDGWYDNAGFSGSPITSISASETGNRMYYAKWLKVYNISYETDGGTLGSDEITSYVETRGALLPTYVAKDRFVFDGWYDNAEFSGSPITSISASETGNKIYYAKYINLSDYLTTFEAITDKDNVIISFNTDWFNISSNSDSNTPAKIQSKSIKDNQNSDMIFTVTIPENNTYAVVFDYLVSSETFDKLRISIDGNSILAKGGNNITGNCVAKLTAGNHTIKFSYKKDSSVSSYRDMAQISNLEFEKIDGDFMIASADFNTPSATIVAMAEKTATLVFVAYDSNNKVLSTDIQSEQLLTVGKKVYTPTSNFETTGATKISVMLWENLNNMKPLCKVLTCDKSLLVQ